MTAASEGSRERSDERSRERSDEPRSAQVSADMIVCAGGPLLVRGDHLVRDEDGVEHPTWRPISAICRCGRSTAKPWCDGTHKVVPDKQRP